MTAERTDTAATALLMPRLGHAMTEGTVVEWHTADGARVEAGMPVVTIETDKATYELEAPASGTLVILVPADAEVPVGTELARIGATDRVAAGVAPGAADASTAGPAVRGDASAPSASGRPVAAATPGARPFASPKARRLAREHGLDLAALVPANGDLIVARDVEQAAAAASTASASPAGAPARVRATPKARRLAAERGVDLARVTASDGEMISAEDVERAAASGRRRETGRTNLTGVRRTAARRLTESWQQVPHIVQMVDVDASGLLARREAARGALPGLTINDLFLFAVARTLAAHPHLNAGFELPATRIDWAGVDVGFAAETDRGLVVPVIRGADALPLEALVAERERLVAAAATGRLGPDDMGGASLTVSNLGMFGIRAGTPVLNTGEPMLVFVGAVEPRAVADGERVVVRPQCTLSIAYDHRIIDGAAAARFTAALKVALEAADTTVTAENATDEGPEADTDEDGALDASGTALRVAAQSAGDRYAVRIGGGRHDWTLDEPGDDGGEDSGPDPVRSVLGALLGCTIIALKAAARRRGVTIINVDGEALADASPPTRIDLHLAITSPDPAQAIGRLVPVAERTCRVRGMLRPDLPVELHVSLLEPG